MATTQKALIAQIELMEKKLQFEQMKVMEHKKYFHCFMQNHPLALVAAIIPVFVWGWKKGRGVSGVGLFTQAMEIGLIAVTARFKQIAFNKISSFLTK